MTLLSQVVKAHWCPKSTATFLRDSNTANFRIRCPSLAAFTHKLSDWRDRSHTEMSYQHHPSITVLMACHTPTPLFLLVSPVSEHAENNWHILFDSTTQSRSCLHHLSSTATPTWPWTPLMSESTYQTILLPPTGQKSTSLLSHLLLIIIRPARFFCIVVCLYMCIFSLKFSCLLCLLYSCAI